MRFTYFDKASKILQDSFGLDAIKDVALNRDDKIICFAQVNVEDPTLHLVVGNFSSIGFDDTSSIKLSDIFDTIDLNNSYAEVGGHIEYYNSVVNEINNFETVTNITFPIKNKRGRYWIRVTSVIIDKDQFVQAFHFTIVTDFINEEEEIFFKTHHDSLTNVFNKYTMDFHYGERYQKENFHVLYLDLDDFKLLNDTLGHREGNVYLRDFANILLSHEKEYSRFYRIGGDEFVGLFFDTKEEIIKIAEDIIQRTIALSSHTNEVTTSVSIGIVQATKRDDVIRKADALMYKAKELGKNRYLYELEK